MFRRMSRSLILAAAASMLVGCGGVPIPTHAGYKSKNAEPWKKPKEIKLDANNVGKADGDLDYKEFRRAKWYVVNIPRDGDLSVNLEVTPPGEDKFDLAMEVLDSNWNVLTKSDKDDDDGFELKKAKNLIELRPGAYYIHLYLEGRLDTAEYELQVKYAPGSPAIDPNDNFPHEVAFVPDLPVVPLQDDTPVTKPTGGGGHGGHGGGGGGGHTTTTTTTTTTTGGGPPVAARIVDVRIGGSGTQITINKGTDAGLKDGSKGSIDGVKGGSFEAFGCSPTRCKGNVSASVDEVNRSGKATVNP
jgi:hypothetical protein